MVRDRVMSIVSSVCRRRRADFRNFREHSLVKINNRRAVAVRFNAATRGIRKLLDATVATG